MFELEVGTRLLERDALPQDAQKAFAATAERVLAFSLTPWEEHCTECAMPACYSTCDLYAPRMDGKCRRFLAGIEIIPFDEHPQGYVARVAFKRWAQLMSYANARLVRRVEARHIERRVRQTERIAASLPIASVSIAGRRGIPSRMVRRWKQRVAARAGESLSTTPDCLLIEVYNPEQRAIRVSLSITNPGLRGRPPFQELHVLEPGYTALEIATRTIAARIDLARELHITLNPNILSADEEGLTLYFGLIAFVQLSTRPESMAPEATRSTAGKAIKVAVWDLDNTLWSGTLVEDGPSGIRLRHESITVVRELDRRGIVNSILSKNDCDEAREALKRFGVDDLFVYPRIDWDDKGTIMTSLIADFNVDATTLAFIDDQEFERARVTGSNPGVRAYDTHNLLDLLDRPEFNPPLSTESASRRQFYQAEERRSRTRNGFSGDYLEFLRTCGLRADIRHPDKTTLDRVQELVQRTNQLNYSGTHYTRKEIIDLINRSEHESFTVSCVDAFGDYGTVGFLLVDREKHCLCDAMFSCRIQFKRVEHAVLTFLLHRYQSLGGRIFEARFRETKKNAAAAAVFTDMAFVEASREGAVRSFQFDLQQPIPHDRIVMIEWEGAAWEPPGIASGV